MHIERASDDVYVFTSERYAQVTATLIVSGTVGVMIDTLPYPSETAQIARLAQKVAPDGVRYLVYTQHQADHVYGAIYFPRAEIISHTLCRQHLIKKGYAALEEARKQTNEFEFTKIKLPTTTFDTGTFSLRLPNKTLDMIATPGHTDDSISLLLQEEKILFAGDTVMALPTIADGDVGQLKASLTMISDMPLDSIVQGHGEIILKGEIKDYLKRSINYLDQLDARVRGAIASGVSREEARQQITIESCGMGRVLLNGQVTPLHTTNVLALYDRVSPPKNVKPTIKLVPEIKKILDPISLPTKPVPKPEGYKSRRSKPPARKPAFLKPVSMAVAKSEPLKRVVVAKARAKLVAVKKPVVTKKAVKVGKKQATPVVLQKAKPAKKIALKTKKKT